MMHYASTYGVEAIAGLLGFDVTVGEGWMPDVESTEKTKKDEKLVADKVLHVVVARDDMRRIVTERLAKATRMHETEIRVAIDALADGDGEPPRVAFHENMMEIIRTASEGTAAELERVASGLAQHPGDLVKATRHILDANGGHHLMTRQKKGLCRAFERFGADSIARNIAEASKANRGITNFLSVARFGGPNLRRGIELVETGQVKSWNSEVEALWKGVDGTGSPQAWKDLLAKYGERPGMLLRSLTRLAKGNCPLGMLADEVLSHADSYSVPTLVRNLALMTALDDGLSAGVDRMFGGRAAAADAASSEQREAYEKISDGGVAPNQFAADAYDCVKAIAQAIEEAGLTPDQSAQDLCEALIAKFTDPSFVYAGLTGEATWKDTGEVSKSPKGVVIQNGVYIAM